MPYNSFELRYKKLKILGLLKKIAKKCLTKVEMAGMPQNDRKCRRLEHTRKKIKKTLVVPAFNYDVAHPQLSELVG